MIDLNYTVWIQMVNFLLLILILNFLLYKPILKIIDKRNKMMEESQEEVRSLQQSVDQKMSDYEEQLRQARAEAASQRDAVKEEGSEVAKKILEEARNEVSQTIGELKAKMGREREDARTILRERTQEIALEISEKVLGRGIQ